MRKDKVQALKLRLSGKSYNEISRLLGIPKGTLSYWFSRLELSEKAQNRIKKRVFEGSLRGLLKRNRNQTHLAIQRRRRIRLEAKQEIGLLTITELKLVGVALYWAEGYKRVQIRNGREVTHHPVALTNSDPRLIGIFMRFLREACQVSDDNIRADIRIYEHMNEKELVSFWQKITKLPIENFSKFYYGVSKSSLGKRPFNRLPYGTVQIRVNNTNLFHRIMGWLEGLSLQG
ncbi:MAG: helix-turn-helix domain-containing protein [Candidatus Portnoybacteria bacterium]|nr:helix-turn-helix domain-containing protein [Candidatus Portnoybacteria bacterium]